MTNNLTLIVRGIVILMTMVEYDDLGFGSNEEAAWEEGNYAIIFEKFSQGPPTWFEIDKATIKLVSLGAIVIEAAIVVAALP